MDLRRALGLNAALSFALGAFLTVAAPTAAGWLGVPVDGWLRILGVGLLVHGVLLVRALNHHAITRWALLNLVVIGPYPVMLLALVAVGSVSTSLGRTLLLADALAVGLLAVAQWTGLRATTWRDTTVTA